MASEKNRVLTLEDLCKIDHLTNQDSVEKLGVLRMDIDNLGQLFMHGFDAKGSSFSKLATLSALLDQFFSGYLNTIKRKEPYRQHINIVYSGGDDLFAVGRWDTIIDFAIEIRNEFRRFVCGREDISISGSIAIVGAKFPIAKAAEEAAIAETDAKEFELLVGNEKYTKNTLCLFGIPVHFELEIPFIVECKNDLVTWSGDIMSKGFLMKMFDYYQIYKDDKPDWQWQSAYSLARYAKEAKNNPQKMEVINFSKHYYLPRVIK
ncbi:MAG: hypothetical protein IPF62_01630 [Bacteroidetes bacterium]|nr:hypothetical protein [Bacteroidota bacterium]